jgi:hypothetical protein
VAVSIPSNEAGTVSVPVASSTTQLMWGINAPCERPKEICEQGSSEGVHVTTRSFARDTAMGIANGGLTPPKASGATTAAVKASTVPPAAVTVSVAPGIHVKVPAAT